MKQPQVGQVWWTTDGEGQAWRIVTLESRHPHRLGASWLAHDMETWKPKWMDECRWDASSPASRLMGPEASDAEFFMFSFSRVPAAPLP